MRKSWLHMQWPRRICTTTVKVYAVSCSDRFVVMDCEKANSKTMVISIELTALRNYNSLHYSQKASYKILECVCENCVPIQSNKTIIPQTLLLAQCIQVGRILLESAKTRFVY